MPVYAHAVGFAEQRRHPSALILIVGVHAVLIGAVMTAKMDLPQKIERTITEVTFIDPPKPPPPEPQKQPPKPQPQNSAPYIPPTEVPIPMPKGPDIDTTPIPTPLNDLTIGMGFKPVVPVIPTVVRTGPRFATPDWALRPPYPADKQRLEQEAVLKLRLTIDEHGRVTAVDPIGNADRSFLDAARKHLIAKWRYKPATEDGRAIPSSTVITLRFELDSA